MTVVVRFAPSPTGLLHIGNARAALINWLFAKKHNGKFILRLDDTDTERSKKSFEQAIYEDMAWLGLHHDETFKQSERFDRYNQVKQQLIDAGRLYPCYETLEELEFKRKRQLAKGHPPIYDRYSLNLNEAQKKELEASGLKPHWRFLLKNEMIKWDDLVRGSVEFQGGLLGDPVLIRADGLFLYSLCSVIDDLDYGVTHIIRGEDHVANTASQLQMFEAISETKNNITFGHTTLLMDEQGKALSKRLGSLSLQQMKENGIEPMAINSLLARLGTSLPVEPVVSMEELAKNFDLSTFSRTPPRFDEKELYTLNHKLYNIIPFSHIKEQLSSWVKEEHWQIIRSNIHTLKDLESWQKIIIGEIDGNNAIDLNFIKSSLELLPGKPWNENTWKNWTELLSVKTSLKGKALFMPLRKALTGMEHGPEMKTLILLIGYEKIKNRLNRIIQTK